MVLKLFGCGLPTCTRLVGAVLREKEIPFQMVAVNVVEGEQKSPSFMVHQPFGKVPFIVRAFYSSGKRLLMARHGPMIASRMTMASSSSRAVQSADTSLPT